MADVRDEEGSLATRRQCPARDDRTSRTPPRRLPRPATFDLLVLTACLCYWCCSRRDYSYAEIWCHVDYGRSIWCAGAIPETEPLLPLSAGVELVDPAWLAQLALYGAHRACGDGSLRCLSALATTLCFCLVAVQIRRRTRSLPLTLAGLALFGWVAWGPLLVAGPRVAGLACFIALFGIVVGRRWSRANWVAVPAISMLWANLDASFPMGLLLLGSFAAGRAIDVAWRSHRLGAIIADAKTCRLAMVLQIAAASTLLNPYGFRIYPDVLSRINHPNLGLLERWAPLTLRDRQGLAVVAAVALVALLYRLTPRRVPSPEFLTLAGLGAATLWTSEAVLWWAAPLAYYAALHGHAIGNGRRMQAEASGPLSVDPVGAQSRDSGTLSAARVLYIPLVWFSISSSPIVSTIRGAVPVGTDSNALPVGPVGAANFFAGGAPREAGLVFCPLEWGGYLSWKGCGRVGVCANSQVHLLPAEIARSYLAILKASDGWERALDSLGVTAVVADPREQADLVGRLGRDRGWYRSHDDGRAVVFLRRKPIRERSDDADLSPNDDGDAPASRESAPGRGL